MRFEMAQIFLPDFVYSLFTGTVFKFHKQVHTINNKEHGLLLLISGQCGASQSAALLASVPCAKYSTFMVAIRFVQHWIVPFSHPFSPLDISVWQVPGSIIVGPHSWKAWVFHQAGRDDRKQESAMIHQKAKTDPLRSASKAPMQRNTSKRAHKESCNFLQVMYWSGQIPLANALEFNFA